MASNGADAVSMGPGRVARQPNPPQLSVAVGAGVVSVVLVVVSGWLATRPGAEQAQTGLVRWFNHPPDLVAAVFVLVSPFFRPWPLTVLAIVLVGWILLSSHRRAVRLETICRLAVALASAEVLAQALKRLAAQPRPLEVVPGLDAHGYPGSPHGNAFPSAHTALAVAAVAGIWPWLSWPQRIVGLVLAVLVACDRIYIGAHWPIDVIGGAAVGLLSAAVVWLIAAWRSVKTRV